MSRPEYTIEWDFTVRTDHPGISDFTDAVDSTERGSLEHARAVAELATECYHLCLATESYKSGHRDGHDDGAAPYLDGPWWKRAWTAARS